MQRLSLQRQIHRRHGVWVRPDRDVTCPRCQRETFRLAQSEQTAICRHAECGFRESLPHPLFGDALLNLYNDCHEALLAPGCAAAKQLVETDGIHPTVLAEAMLGILPRGRDVADYFAPVIMRLQQEAALEQGTKKKGRPKNDEEPSAADRLEELKEHATRLADVLKGKPDAPLVFYQDQDRQTAAIRILQPSGRSQWFRTGEGTGVFGLDLDAILPRAADAPEVSTLWCADFKDVLRSQSAGARAAQAHGLAPETGYYPALALARHYPDALTACAVSRPVPVVCTGVAGFPDESLVRLNRATNLRVVPLSAFPVGATTTSLDPLTGLIATAALSPRPLEEVRRECDRARRNNFAKPFEIDRRVADIIVRDFGERGRYYCDTRTGYLFLHETKALLPIDPEDHGFQALLHQCGLAKTDSTYKAAATRLDLHAREYGELTKVSTFSHWDHRRQCLYVFDFARTVYRISPDTIEPVHNGTDGKLFLPPPGATPYTPYLSAPDHSLLDELLFESVNFIPSRLTVQDQRLLTRIFFYALFVPDLLPTRPILAAVGPAGSGKTSTLRRIGQAPFGPNFQVSPLSKDLRDVDAALTNSAFVVLDNADNPVAGLEDRLATAATAGSIKLRKLYSTNTQVEFPITAYVSITSRTPHFRREDVADRLLLVQMDRRTGHFLPEHQLTEALMQNRDALMGEVFRDLQKIVRQLKADAEVVFTEDHRMADFARFAIVVGRALNCCQQVEWALEHLNEQRTDFATENDPFIELLEFWLESGTATDTPLTAGQLLERLRQCARREGLPFEIASSSALGLELNKRWTTLQKLYGATSRKSGGRRVFYRFRPPAAASPEYDDPMPDLDTLAGSVPDADDPDWGPGPVDDGRVRKVEDAA